jgi:multiple sugar transport system substrate-binding protein
MAYDQIPDGKGPLTRRTFLKAAAATGVALGTGSVGQALAESAAWPRMASSVAQLKFWDMVWGPPEYITSAKNLVAQFNKTHPSIQVSYQSIPWTNWYQTYATALGSGTGPDISTGAGYQAMQFADKGYILPLDPLVATMKKSGSLADFLPGTVDVLKYKGQQVAIPWQIDIRVLYYRKDLFAKAGIAKPPSTWAELQADAQKLTNKSNHRFGFGMSGDTLGEHIVLSFMLNNGGGLFTSTGQPDMTDPRNLEAVTFLDNMAKAGIIDPAGAGWQSADLEKAFGNGTVAITIDSPGQQNRYPASVGSQVGIVPPLKGPHGNYGTLSWVNNIMAYKETKNPEAVYTFLEWYSENQLPLFTQGHVTAAPTRKSFVANSYFKTDPYMSQIIKEYIPIGETTATHSPSLFPALNAVEGEGFLQTMAQQIILGQNPSAIMSRAASGLTSTLQGQ